MSALAMFAFGILLRQMFGFQMALRKLGGQMATLENVGVPTTHYQNSLTPPWLVKVIIVLWLGSVGTLVASGYFAGMRAVGADFLAFIGGVLISGSAIKLLSWPTDETYYRVAFHTLVNREADYRRDGDTIRAEAAQRFQVLMIALLRPDLLGGEASTKADR